MRTSLHVLEVDPLRISKYQLNSLELFAGAGGLALGVEAAGFRHVAVIERDSAACATIRQNFKWPLIETDARNFDYSAITKPISLLSGGPPCQPFSLGGKGLAAADDRNMLPETIRAVRALQPKVFLIENVKGILRPGGATYLDYVRLQLKFPEHVCRSHETAIEHLGRLEKYETSGSRSDIGYNVLTRLVNAADYGVPQLRERVFIVGFRRDLGIKWSFPVPTHSLDSLIWSQWKTEEYCERHGITRAALGGILGAELRASALENAPQLRPWVTTRDAIFDLSNPTPTDTGVQSISNHTFLAGARLYAGHTGSQLDTPAKTLKAGVHGVPGGENMLVGTDGKVRYFTVRECARLQTFPDYYEFRCAWGSAVKQLGNAVPVTLARVIAESIFKAIRTAARRSS